MLILREALIFVEGILGRKHRREWSVAENRRIVAEANRSGTNKSAVARRHGISDSQLYSWRKVLGNKRDAHFLPVIKDEASPGNIDGSSGSIDNALSNGHRLTVSGAVDLANVGRLLLALADASAHMASLDGWVDLFLRARLTARHAVRNCLNNTVFQINGKGFCHACWPP